MDTSGLGSSLSLVTSLAVFAYLSLVEAVLSPAKQSARTAHRLDRIALPLRLLRLASVIAVVLSAVALLLGQTPAGVVVITIVFLDLLAFLVVVGWASRRLAIRYPLGSSKASSPLSALLQRLPNLAELRESVIGDPEPANRDHSGQGPEPLEAATSHITDEEQAQLADRERLMIRSILRLDDSVAREIMVPRVDIVAVDADTSLRQVASHMMEYGHSRLPVYRKTIDDIIGVVYSRDLLPYLAETEEHASLEQTVRPAFFIPESKRLDELLKELQEKRVHMALVVDEYGGIEGLVTLEDLLEEIVGEIEDEFSRSHEPSVVPLEGGDVEVDSGVTLEYLSDLLSTPIEREGADTVGGLVYSALGKIPAVGDEVVHNGLRIEVVSVLGRRIRKLRLGRTEAQKAS